MEALVSPLELSRLQAAVVRARPAFLRDLERLVNVDSGSYTKAGVDEVGTWTATRLSALGARISRHRNDELGDTIVATFEAARPEARPDDGVETGPSVLVIGHLDTVFEPGTVAERPFAIRGERACGPGVSDMKAGLLAGLYALAALREVAAEERQGPLPDISAWLPVRRLVFVANPDEEIGSPVSSPVIRDLAESADVALVLECARANGDIVSARKGMMDIRLTVHGRAAHAGVEPEKGRSAILEAAHKIVALHALNGRWPDVTVNAGVVRGGTRPNIVAPEAQVVLDVRAAERASLEAAEAAIAVIAATSSVPDVTATVELAARHWPMQKLPASERLVSHAVGLAAALGFELRDAATGGASDANTTSGLGVPTLDGLGPIGGSDHAPDEYVEIASIAPRTTLLAALLLAIGRDPLLRTWRSRRPL
jgi:glutamate carboxypeptidase